MSRRLDLVITSVAAKLMDANASTATKVSQQVLAHLVEQFGVDAAFLRYNDCNIRASKLVAEWPPRCNRPYPDPLEVVQFANADPVFAYCADGKKPIVIELDPANSAHRAYGRVAERRRVASPSVAVAPLVWRGVTTGLLGFVNFGGMKWTPKLMNTLAAIAPMFAGFQVRIATEEKLRHLAEHDDLTGLNNRRSLVAHLSDRLAAGRSGPVAVLYLDVDRLKSINDYFGHDVGDFYLRVFADRLRASMGGLSVIGRHGGDEFVVIPDGAMSSVTAESLAHRLRTTLRSRLQIGDDVIAPSVSIGVAVGSPGLDSIEDLLRRADGALLAAKRAGGNQVAVSSDAISLSSIFRNDVEVHLQAGIDNDAFLLDYLPEFDLLTGEILGAEALVRWRHPTRGLLLPNSFIGVAESSNLAGDLGRWVMRTACAEFSRWRSHGVAQNATLCINVSPAQLTASGFVSDVADIIRNFGINADSVCLEITERAVVGDIESTRRSLAKLKEVGVQIAIDDFGTGCAVLSHLMSLPVNTLKIDPGFVRNLGTNPEALAIVRAIIGLAEAFGLELIAEGVETQIAAKTLMRHGCCRAQGFLLSRPVTGSDMESLLSARRRPVDLLAHREALTVGSI